MRRLPKVIKKIDESSILYQNYSLRYFFVVFTFAKNFFGAKND